MSDTSDREDLAEIIDYHVDMPDSRRLAIVDAILAAGFVSPATVAARVAEGKAAAWDEGAIWAAIECGAIERPENAWLVPDDNPYRAADIRTESETPVTITSDSLHEGEDG